jgi:hypothetical protein
MSDELISDIVRDFIASNIDSIAELEALLLIRREPQLKWTAADLAERLYTSPAQAEGAMVKLTERGLSCIKEGKPVTYYYRPSSPELDRIVGEVADTYSRYLIQVTNLIHSKPQMKVQQFADAFKLRSKSDK